MELLEYNFYVRYDVSEEVGRGRSTREARFACLEAAM